MAVMPLVFFFSLSLFTLIQSDCPLPTQADIEQGLTALLLNADNSQTYYPTLIGSVRYVCQAQGSVRDTYTSVSIIATYTPNSGQSHATNIFQLMCNSSSSWEGDVSSGLDSHARSIVGNPTRIDCAQCSHDFGDDRCEGTCMNVFDIFSRFVVFYYIIHGYID